jgi:hypothetical protein
MLKMLIIIFIFITECATKILPFKGTAENDMDGGIIFLCCFLWEKFEVGVLLLVGFGCAYFLMLNNDT